MIEERVGNVLDIPFGIVVHGCNSHGVMGSGIAKEVKARFPGAFKVYADEYARRVNKGCSGLELGSLTVYAPETELIIVNAVTQQDYGREPGHVYVDYNAMYSCFVKIKNIAVEQNMPVNFPLIGCGLANGDWNIVSAIIEDALGPDVEKILWKFTP